MAPPSYGSGAALLGPPSAIFLYGWTAQARVQFTAPIIGTALLDFWRLRHYHSRNDEFGRRFRVLEGLSHGCDDNVSCAGFGLRANSILGFVTVPGVPFSLAGLWEAYTKAIE